MKTLKPLVMSKLYTWRHEERNRYELFTHGNSSYTFTVRTPKIIDVAVSLTTQRSKSTVPALGFIRKATYWYAMRDDGKADRTFQVNDGMAEALDEIIKDWKHRLVENVIG